MSDQTPGGGSSYQPFVPESMTMKELTLRAVIPGLFMCLILGAANAYLGLRAGQTIAAPLSNFMTVGPTEWLIQVDFFNWSCSSLAALVGYGPCSLPTTRQNPRWRPVCLRIASAAAA